jgi:hypothetical protein
MGFQWTDPDTGLWSAIGDGKRAKLGKWGQKPYMELPNETSQRIPCASDFTPPLRLLS